MGVIKNKNLQKLNKTKVSVYRYLVPRTVRGSLDIWIPISNQNLKFGKFQILNLKLNQNLQITISYWILRNSED